VKKTKKIESNEGFVAHWRRVGPKLEEIRRRELKNLDHKKQWRIIDALLFMRESYGPLRRKLEL
jgi:hypothetical protein